MGDPSARRRAAAQRMRDDLADPWTPPPPSTGLVIAVVGIIFAGLSMLAVLATSKSYADGLADGRAECAHEPSRIESAGRWLAEPRGSR